LVISSAAPASSCSALGGRVAAPLLEDSVIRDTGAIPRVQPNDACDNRPSEQ
jgi:hypothetical protein